MLSLVRFSFLFNLLLISNLAWSEKYAIDFSLDNDWKPDDDGNYSYASLQKENFPSSFTICMNFLVEKWGKYANSPLFLLLDAEKKAWLYVELNSSPAYTEFMVLFADHHFTVTSPSLFFPMQWTRVCFSFNSNNSRATLVVDGKRLMEKVIPLSQKRLDLDLVLGLGDGNQETPGMVTNVHIFSEPKNTMEAMTKADTEHCGAPGDYVSWLEEDWIVHSKARFQEVDSAKRPCRRESKMHVFPLKEYHDHSYCMQLCEKLGGRAPPVKTFDEWQDFVKEVKHIQVEPLGLPERLWLSATEGT